MKCSHCYADNPIGASICRTCNRPVLPLEFCPEGHLLPPGSRVCAICPSVLSWPSVPGFEGPPVLRGVLLAVKGKIVGADGAAVEFIELRDSPTPYSLARREPAVLEAQAGDRDDAVAKFLVRPTGVSLCSSLAKSLAWGRPQLTYESLSSRSLVDFGDTRVMFIAFRGPFETESSWKDLDTLRNS